MTRPATASMKALSSGSRASNMRRLSGATRVSTATCRSRPCRSSQAGPPGQRRVHPHRVAGRTRRPGGGTAHHADSSDPSPKTRVSGMAAAAGVHQPPATSRRPPGTSTRLGSPRPAAGRSRWRNELSAHTAVPAPASGPRIHDDVPGRDRTTHTAGLGMPGHRSHAVRVDAAVPEPRSCPDCGRRSGPGRGSGIGSSTIVITSGPP